MNFSIRDLFNKNYIEAMEAKEALNGEIDDCLNDPPIGENDHELLAWLAEEEDVSQEIKEVNTYLGIAQ